MKNKLEEIIDILDGIKLILYFLLMMATFIALHCVYEL